MSNSGQITPDLQAIGSNLQELDAKNMDVLVKNAFKPLKGKYDGRGKYKRKKRAIGDPSRPGPKPLWTKHLPRNDAAKTLQQFDSIVSPADLYARVVEKNNWPLAWQMRCDVENRLLGRPFVAVNPAQQAQSPALQQDNRLQLAIQTLNITAPTKKKQTPARHQAQLSD